jgi:hypothetical protein
MQRWTIYDRYGNQLYLTEERWRHALEKRPWLGDLFDDVFDAVRRGRRQQDPLNPRKYKYYLRCPKLLPEFLSSYYLPSTLVRLTDVFQTIMS